LDNEISLCYDCHKTIAYNISSSIRLWAAVCLASFAILAGGLVALYGLDWYYKNRKQNRKSSRKVEEEVEDYNNTMEPLAEQLA
jgi:predicted histidine transporter YuiF (NhaC family)